MSLIPFLTSYDPSDLPGGSIDPLGFERGYIFLADKILPGLTNVASRPRYFSLLCAGVALADADGVVTLREQRSFPSTPVILHKDLQQFVTAASRRTPRLSYLTKRWTVPHLRAVRLNYSAAKMLLSFSGTVGVKTSRQQGYLGAPHL